MQLVFKDDITALISDEDYDKICHINWRAVKRPHGYYVSGKFLGKTLMLHRVIMGLEQGDRRVVDHINNNPLDNTRENLRVCSSRENSRNLRKNAANTSGFKGVCWSKSHNKWEVRIRTENGRKLIGRFEDKVDAAVKYDEAAVALFGEFANTNKKMGLL